VAYKSFQKHCLLKAFYDVEPNFGEYLEDGVAEPPLLEILGFTTVVCN